MDELMKFDPAVSGSAAMSDLVQRLRSHTFVINGEDGTSSLLVEAADEIEHANHQWRKTIDQLNESTASLTKALAEIAQLRADADLSKRIVEAAKDVVAWDWSENDDECVADMDRLSKLLDEHDKRAEIAAIDAQRAGEKR